MDDLTDSFCERCGTRYAFVANAPKGVSLKGARVLARGLKNFVLTDGQSISDAMELARLDDDREASSRVAEAFHRTFNFCMSCRQYACDRCWNTVAGACLSCSPSPEAEFAAAHVKPPLSRPATADELPILRGLASPSEPEWSLFAEAEAADPSQDATPPSHEPIVFGERRPERPPRRPDPAAWPAADRIATTGGSNRRSGRESGRKPVNADAAAAWPVTDGLAPEMTLTPEELEMVQANLNQTTSQGDSQAPLLREQPTWWNSRPEENESQAPDWSLDGGVEEDRPARDVEPATPAYARAAAPESSEPAEESQEAWSDEPFTLETDLPPVSPRLLRRTSTADDLPPLAAPEPEPGAHEAGGLVARLFGKRAPEAEPSAPAKPRRSSPRRGQTTGEAWPHPTAWSERSLEGRHWWLEADVASGAAPMTADGVFPPERADSHPVLTPEPVREVREGRLLLPSEQRSARPAPPARNAPAPSQPSHVDIDSRSAAALRLSAVEAAMGLPPSDEAEPEAVEVQRDTAAAPAAPAARAYEPAWVRVQREAAEPEPASSIDVPDEAPAAAAAPGPEVQRQAVEERMEPVHAQAASGQTTEPEPAPAQESPIQSTFDMPVAPTATPWPPLGASWPARDKPGAPWPAPDATAVPAVVAAGGAPAPTMAEMWVQSAQEVLNRGSVRVCHHCALPVSTKARFCRRCGTQQV